MSAKNKQDYSPTVLDCILKIVWWQRENCLIQWVDRKIWHCVLRWILLCRSNVVAACSGQCCCLVPGTPWLLGWCSMLWLVHWPLTLDLQQLLPTWSHSAYTLASLQNWIFNEKRRTQSTKRAAFLVTSIFRMLTLMLLYKLMIYSVFLSDIICFLFCSCGTLNFECKFLGAEPGVISVCKVSRISTELYEQLEYCPINCKAKISSCHNAKT